MSLAVVGTDTGVGKTIITAGLVDWLRDETGTGRAIKPCQTGYPPDDDAEFVARRVGQDEAAVCLRRLEPALAPEVAAQEADETLSYERIRSGVESELDTTPIGVVEGIGGLRVPLADGLEVIDLVADLALETIVVARSGLGTLNHTALTVEALERRSIPVRGIVLNEYEDETLAERTNPETLEAMTKTQVATVPPLSIGPDQSLERERMAIERIREFLPTVFLGPELEETA